jgi:hypothetical protein
MNKHIFNGFGLQTSVNAYDVIRPFQNRLATKILNINTTKLSVICIYL